MPLTVPQHDSSLALNVTVPLAKVRDAVSQTVPSEFPFGGFGTDACLEFNLGGWGVIKGKTCAGTRYEGVAHVSGPISISGTGNTLTVAVPLEVNGNGGLRGDLAGGLKLDKKNFRAAFRIVATASLDLGADGCPVMSVSPGIEWIDNPRVEIVERVWVDVKGEVEGKLRDKLNSLASTLSQSVHCDDLRNELAKVWRVHTLPIPGVDALPASVHLVPISLGFSGLAIDNDNIRFGLLLKARTEVSTETTAPTDVGYLPALVKVAAEPGHLSLSLPIRANYQTLAKALTTTFGGKTFESRLAGANVSVTPTGFAIYPSGDKLAVGISFSAKAPWHLFDASGQIFLTAKPVIEKNGTVIGLTEVAFSRKLDNALYTALSVVFEQQINTAIIGVAQIDLTETIAEQLKAAQTLLADPKLIRTVRLTIRDAKANVESLVPETSTLAALVKIDVDIDASVQDIPVQHTASQ